MFAPAFMQRLDEFRKERASISTLDEWMAFAKKWLDTEDWLLKTAGQTEAEGMRKCGPVVLGGRKWVYTSWNYDVSPEARYEYFYTLRGFGDVVRFPEVRSVPKTAENGYRQECPYCEISTREIGGPTCPTCGRALIFTRYAY